MLNNNKGPVRIRRNVHDYDDPYISDEQLQDHTECKLCGDMYISGRWYNKSQVPVGTKKTSDTVCPACVKMRDRDPGGELRMSGQFMWDHKDEILNLVRNETNKAQSGNPLERVIGIETVEDEIYITTTNEKLAQHIGKALHKAYSGEVEYKWSEDNKQARVNWNREA